MIEGRVIRVGDDVNTDLILPGPYLNLSEPKELAATSWRAVTPKMARDLRPGDVIVAGENFGCGSSREQAPVALLARGIRAVVAASFARIFLRNAINLGLPALESRAAAQALGGGEVVMIDWAAGSIETKDGRRFQAQLQPPFIADLIAAGGLVPWVERRLAHR
jgi:3-isopropylmalate/(R)-2-methylmalate dehydratase small subunit